jgi:ABC-type transport system substrate-binding protein
MRRDATWSDGAPIRAADVVFTFETVRDFKLGGNWLHAYPLADGSQPERVGLLGVRAVSEFEVEFEFNLRPGLPVWPHAVGLAPIMAHHHWLESVDRARASRDPRITLYAESGASDPSGGPMVFTGYEPGAFMASEANPLFHNSNEAVESGDVAFRSGPFIDQATFSFFGEQAGAVLALQAGEIDYILNPLGMQRGLLGQVGRDEELVAVSNPSNGFRYLGFNLRRSPMSIPEFRDALALMIDKEFVADSVLQGVAFPLYVSLPEGNERWYNAAVAAELAAPYVGKSTAERLAEAVAVLKEGGFSWDREPAMLQGNVVPGEGIAHNGEKVRPLEILAPGQGYDPLRATYAVWIETWLEQLGFDAEANPTDFNSLVTSIYIPNAEGELDFDLYLLGWSLGDPSLPSHYEEFWSSRHDTLATGGNNTTGFSHEGFDALVDRFNATVDEAEAYDLIWEMERLIAREKPYIILFDTGIVEIYRADAIEYPFTQTLSGIQNLQGMQGLVRQMK